MQTSDLLLNTRASLSAETACLWEEVRYSQSPGSHSTASKSSPPSSSFCNYEDEGVVGGGGEEVGEEPEGKVELESLENLRGLFQFFSEHLKRSGCHLVHISVTFLTLTSVMVILSPCLVLAN